LKGNLEKVDDGYLATSGGFGTEWLVGDKLDGNLVSTAPEKRKRNIFEIEFNTLFTMKVWKILALAKANLIDFTYVNDSKNRNRSFSVE
jgi:hypothetical protein